MQALLVALLVAGAAAYAAWKLLPAAWLPRALRRRLPPASGCAGCAPNPPQRPPRSRPH